MPRLVAIKEHKYDGKLRHVGDAYEATDRHAFILKRVMKSKDAEAPAVSLMDAMPEPAPRFVDEPPAPAVPRRGRYARRDMRTSEED